MRPQAPGRRCHSGKRALQEFDLLPGVLKDGFKGVFRSNLYFKGLHRSFRQDEMEEFKR
jgi:hypothetical protein